MKPAIVKSYAKINISLNVVGKLPSNLHKIESIASFINIFDLLFIKKINLRKHKIIFKGKFSKKIGKKNTISKHLLHLTQQHLYQQ